MVPIKGTRAPLQAPFFSVTRFSNERGTRCPQRVGKQRSSAAEFSGAYGDSFGIGLRRTGIFGEADPPHRRGGVRGAKVGNGVAVGAGVAVAAGIGVVTCACAPAKKATKPSRTHTLTKAIPDRIRVLAAGCRSLFFIAELSLNNSFEASRSAPSLLIDFI
jgi:hypothetical protein